EASALIDRPPLWLRPGDREGHPAVGGDVGGDVGVVVLRVRVVVERGPVGDRGGVAEAGGVDRDRVAVGAVAGGGRVAEGGAGGVTGPADGAAETAGVQRVLDVEVGLAVAVGIDRPHGERAVAHPLLVLPGIVG